LLLLRGATATIEARAPPPPSSSSSSSSFVFHAWTRNKIFIPFPIPRQDQRCLCAEVPQPIEKSASCPVLPPCLSPNNGLNRSQADWPGMKTDGPRGFMVLTLALSGLSEFAHGFAGSVHASDESRPMLLKEATCPLTMSSVGLDFYLCLAVWRKLCWGTKGRDQDKIAGYQAVSALASFFLPQGRAEPRIPETCFRLDSCLSSHISCLCFFLSVCYFMSLIIHRGVSG
jgi:hypothetical protein